MNCEIKDNCMKYLIQYLSDDFKDRSIFNEFLDNITDISFVVLDDEDYSDVDLIFIQRTEINDYYGTYKIIFGSALYLSFFIETPEKTSYKLTEEECHYIKKMIEASRL